MNSNLEEIGIEKIYIVHDPSDDYRKKRMDNILSKYNLNFEYMIDGSPDLWDKETLITYFEEDTIKSLRKGVLSCTLNHILCYKDILEKKIKYTLIFENDICILKDFSKNLKKIIDEANTLESGFIISLENSTLRFPSIKETKKNKLLYAKNYGRSAGAYIIDINGVKNILDY